MSSPAISYRFTTSPLPSTLLTDLKALNSLSSDQLHAVFNIAIFYLSNQSQQADDSLLSFTQSYQINIKPLRTTLSALLYILSLALQKNLSAETLYEDLIHSSLSTETANIISSCYKTHYITLTSISLSQVLSVNELIDFQWKFGVTAASNEINQMGNTFLQLKMSIRRNESDQNQQQEILMELTLPQFYQFLQQMQIASKQAQLLSK